MLDLTQLAGRNYKTLSTETKRNRNRRGCLRCSTHLRRGSCIRSHRCLDQDVYECVLCGTNHPLRFCRRFLSMTTIKRQKVVDRYNYCTNCLARSHDLRACASLDTCRRCGQYHHTLLHVSRSSKNRFMEITTADLRHRQQQRKQQQQNAQKQRPQQQQQEHQNKQEKATTSSASFQNEPTSRTTEVQNQKAIIDAIYSLATILCGNVRK